jgi:hypothetical protein
LALCKKEGFYVSMKDIMANQGRAAANQHGANQVVQANQNQARRKIIKTEGADKHGLQKKHGVIKSSGLQKGFGLESASNYIVEVQSPSPKQKNPETPASIPVSIPASIPVSIPAFPSLGETPSLGATPSLGPLVQKPDALGQNADALEESKTNKDGEQVYPPKAIPLEHMMHGSSLVAYEPDEEQERSSLVPYEPDEEQDLDQQKGEWQQKQKQKQKQQTPKKQNTQKQQELQYHDAQGSSMSISPGVSSGNSPRGNNMNSKEVLGQSLMSKESEMLGNLMKANRDLRKPLQTGKQIALSPRNGNGVNEEEAGRFLSFMDEDHNGSLSAESFFAAVVNVQVSITKMGEGLNRVRRILSMTKMGEGLNRVRRIVSMTKMGEGLNRVSGNDIQISMEQVSASGRVRVEVLEDRESNYQG